ncbi:MAG: DNA-binding protein [Halobacteriota archaeon]
MEDDELERIRQEKRQRLQESDGEAAGAERERAEAMRKSVLRQALEPEARERLNAIKMAKPQKAEQVERQLVALAQSGRLQGKVTEQQLKQILRQLENDRDINIRRR